MTRYRISHAARDEIVSILAWTHDRYGEQARRRYENLIATGIRELAADPTRPGSRARPELGEGVRTWHLRASRNHSPGGTVRRPRHFLIYRVEPDLVVVGRILHDAMDLRRHVDADTSWR